jgi:hypothetical protein
VVDKVEFWSGTLVAGTSPPRYKVSYGADSHGTVKQVRTYLANCVARSAQDNTKKVPSYSRPMRVKRL